MRERAYPGGSFRVAIGAAGGTRTGVSFPRQKPTGKSDRQICLILILSGSGIFAVRESNGRRLCRWMIAPPFGATGRTPDPML